jgi:hypothetical protein
MANTDARIVDQDVDRPHTINSLGKCCLHLIQGCHIGIKRCDQLWQLFHYSCARLIATIQNTNPRAFFQKSCRGSLANAAGSTRNQHVPSSHALPSPWSSYGSWSILATGNALSL